MQSPSLFLFQRTVRPVQIRATAADVVRQICGSDDEIFGAMTGPLVYRRSLAPVEQTFVGGSFPLKFAYTFGGPLSTVAEMRELPEKLRGPEAAGMTIWLAGPYSLMVYQERGDSPKLEVSRGGPPYDHLPDWESHFDRLLADGPLGDISVRKGLGKPIALKAADGNALLSQLQAVKWRRFTFDGERDVADIDRLLDRLPRTKSDTVRVQFRYPQVLTSMQVDQLAESIGDFREMIVMGSYEDGFDPLAIPASTLFDAAGLARFPIGEASEGKTAVKTEIWIIHRVGADPVIEICVSHPSNVDAAKSHAAKVRQRLGDGFEPQDEMTLDRYSIK